MISNCISSPAPIGIDEEAGQQETRKLVSVETLTPAVEMTQKGSNFSIAPGKEARSFDMLWNRATRVKKRQKDPAMAEDVDLENRVHASAMEKEFGNVSPPESSLPVADRFGTGLPPLTRIWFPFGN